MKFVLMLLLAVLVGSAFAEQSVRGYTRKDGTYVPQHMRSSPDDDRSNNWSSRGNVNPYTGERGYVDPYVPKPQRPSVPDYSRQKR